MNKDNKIMKKLQKQMNKQRKKAIKNKKIFNKFKKILKNKNKIKQILIIYKHKILKITKIISNKTIKIKLYNNNNKKKLYNIWKVMRKISFQERLYKNYKSKIDKILIIQTKIKLKIKNNGIFQDWVFSMIIKKLRDNKKYNIENKKE